MVRADGTIRDARGRFVRREVVETAAIRGGFRYRTPAGEVRRVAIRRDEAGRFIRAGRSVPLEEGRRAKRRTRRDELGAALGAKQFTRDEDASGPRVDVYSLPAPLPLHAAGAALRRLADTDVGAGLDRFDRAHFVARLVDADGQLIYRAMSHAVKGAGAIDEAGATLRAWALRYKRTRLVGVDVIRLSDREVKENERRTEGKRLQARERRDRKRGIRTTRGR